MRVESVQVGRARLMMVGGRTESSAIVKSAVAGRVAVTADGVAGDTQANRAVHGPPLKTVYGYPMEHYERWRQVLPEVDLPAGAFGENLLVSGMLESEVCIGDRFSNGAVELVVTQPRMPCAKLAARMGSGEIGKVMVREIRNGFYFRVATEGQVGAGDVLERVGTEGNGLTVADAVRCCAHADVDRDVLERAVACDALPADWREAAAKKLK